MGFYNRQALPEILGWHPTLRVLTDDDGQQGVVADLGPEGVYLVGLQEDSSILVVDEITTWQEDRGE